VPKKAIIVVSLIDETVRKTNKEIEKEIMDELSRHPPLIPWLKKVEKVTIEESKEISQGS